jgi:hypothetical protein
MPVKFAMDAPTAGDVTRKPHREHACGSSVSIVVMESRQFSSLSRRVPEIGQGTWNIEREPLGRPALTADDLEDFDRPSVPAHSTDLTRTAVCRPLHEQQDFSSRTAVLHQFVRGRRVAQR